MGVEIATDEAWTPAPKGTLALTLGVAASVLLHAVLLAVLALNLWGGAPPGGGGQLLESVSIELVDGKALDARRSAAVEASAGAIGSIAEAEGTPAEAAAEPSVETARAAPDSREENQPAREPDPAPQPVETAAAIMPETPTLVMPEKPPLIERTAELKPEPAAAAEPAATTAAPASGGATAQASVAQPEREARAGASPGEVVRYNGLVSRAIGTLMRKLATSGRRGAVLLVFTIGDDGDAVDVRLQELSGDRVLDSLVVRLVREASFPEPPARMSAQQRTFSVPIRVR